LAIQPLAALSMGPSGAPFEQNGHTWQKMCYEDEKRNIQADFPGSPRSGFVNGMCCLYSQYQESFYEVHLDPSENFQAPKKREEFIRMFKDIPNATITPLSTDQPKIKHVIQIDLFSDSTKTVRTSMVRAYATKDTLYFAIVEGTDYDLAAPFFDSFKILK
jgi:hypothetical protein